MKTELKYFKDAVTINDIKSLYRDLCKQNHPDLGGDLRVMQEINLEYHAVLKMRDGTCYRKDDGSHTEYRYDEASEAAIMAKLSEILAAKLPALDISIIGSWIWITGETKPVSKRLGKDGLGCKYHTLRKCWYWSEKPWRGRSSHSSLEDLADKYGKRSFTSQPVIN